MVMTMQNQDEVIRQSAECSEKQGREVRAALTAYIAEQTDSTRRALRVALVAQAAGHEPSSHDGATFAARKEAARLALEAWDGTAPLVGDQIAHTIGATRIVASRQAWSMAGFRLSHAGMGGPLEVSGSNNDYEPRRVAQALSEGYTHEAALLRAIAIGEASSAARASDYSRLEAAKLSVRAAEEQVHAEAIRAKITRESQT
jgi:hypothetical protein